MTPIVELRQYTLRPGRRDDLVDIFEDHLVEGQEAYGIELPGMFLDDHDPDRFVWLRAFPDVAMRAAALAGFYGGPVWRAHRDAANATMVDSDDVLMLEPVEGTRPLPVSPPRPARGHRDPGGPARRHREPGTARAYAHVHLVDPARWQRVRPLAAAAGAALEAVLGVPVTTLLSSAHPNDFPALPVRAAERALVTFARFPDERARRDGRARLAAARGLWSGPLRPLGEAVVGEQALDLRPTWRSLIR